MLRTVSGMLCTNPGVFGAGPRIFRDALYRLGDALHCPGMLHAVRGSAPGLLRSPPPR